MPKKKDKLESNLFRGKKSVAKLYNGENSFRKNVRNIFLAGGIYTVLYTWLSASVTLMELEPFYFFGIIAWDWGTFLTTLTAVIVPTLIVLLVNEYIKEYRRKRMKNNRKTTRRKQKGK